VIRATAVVYRGTLARKTRFITVVGSYGKTTTARALSLAFTGSIHRYLQNNAGPWPALAVLRTPPGSPYAVAEVGIDARGRMETHARTIRPDVVVVTSIGTEHGPTLGSPEEIRAEKAHMVEALGADGIAVLNCDDPHVAWMRSRTRAGTTTFGRSAGCDVRILETRLEWPHGTRVAVLCGTEKVELRTKLLGDHAQNAIAAALAVAWTEGLPLQDTARRLEALEPMPSRLQLVPLPDGVHLIRNEFKESPATVEVSLDLLGQIPASRRIAVLGQFIEPPGQSGLHYRKFGARIAETAEVAVLVTDEACFQHYRAGAIGAGMAPEAIHHVDRDVRGTLALLKKLVRPNDVVMVKGMGPQRLHRVSLGLMGRQVGCNLETCYLKLVDCDFCSHLGTDWGE